MPYWVERGDKVNDLANKAFGEIYQMLCEARRTAPSAHALQAEACSAQLLHRLSGADTACFGALIDALRAERDEMCADAFGEGFALGTRLAADLLTE